MRISEHQLPSTITWSSPSNIALIKYWGKRPHQLPENPSLSMTLNKSTSVMSLKVSSKDSSTDSPINLKFRFQGQENANFQKRVEKFLLFLYQQGELPFLNQLQLEIDSHNNFPHSAGIASSASGMSALALCLCSLEQELQKTLELNKLNKLNKLNLENEQEFFSRASFLARLASGSASRSVYGPWVVWGKHEDFPGSSDEVSIPFTRSVHPLFREMKDSILIVNSGAKNLSSSQGHALMENHPFAKNRFTLAYQRMEILATSLEKGDWAVFSELVEAEAMMLHGLMLSSQPFFILLQPQTLFLIEKIKKIRQDIGLPLCFTLDAGPNLHLLYPGEYSSQVKKVIEDELAPLCENKYWIDDQIGQGPTLLSELL